MWKGCELMGSLCFRCEVDGPLARQLLGADGGPRQLLIEAEPGSFVEFKAAIQWDETDESRLCLCIESTMPAGLGKFPRWIRGFVRQAWRLAVPKPITDWQFPDCPVPTESTNGIRHWLFKR